jgi:cytochrome c-type biogenesis protein CcmE
MEKIVNSNRTKFIIGGSLIIIAIVILIARASSAGAQFFTTVKDVNEKKIDTANQDVRISGAVIGDSIQYDAETTTLSFTVADIPGDNKTIEAMGGLAEVLHQAVIDPNRSRLKVIYKDVKPDLLKNEAQAIMVGHLGEDGIFYASELLLKCPTKYEEVVPDQTGG